MTTMLALRLHAVGEPPRVDEVPVPAPAPGWVRVRIRACGVCGSDLHVVHGSTPSGPLPLTLGHEPSGVVDEVGDGVEGWSPGQRVSVTPGYGCGACDWCTAGRDNLCPGVIIPGIHRDGSQAEYVVVPVRSLVPLPDAVDFATGAILTDAVATPFHAVRRAGVRQGETVAVFGLGGLGLHAAAILRQVVGAHVIGVDTYPAALDRAARFGVTEVVDASGGKPAAEIRRQTGGGVDHSFEFVGDPAVVDQAVKSLRPAGMCTVVGVTPERLQLLPQVLLVERELRLQGSYGATHDELRELVELVADGTLDLTGTITHRFALRDAADALHVLETKAGDPIRVVVEQPG
jgi:propanol-preferring alcohol dehydrogenase